MSGKINPVSPIIPLQKDPQKQNNQQKNPTKKRTTITPMEGSPSFLEDDLLRREFAGSKFDVKV